MPDKYTIRNFGRNVEFSPRFYYEPRDEAEVLEILERHRGQHIRVGGRLHSWSEAIRGEDVFIDLRNLNRVGMERRADGLWAIVGGGCQIRRLLAELTRQADATLPTIGLITAQTIAGAISTGTHGSGRHSLSHYVDEVRLATYDRASGQPLIRTITDADDLRAARCSLGAMGVILSVTVPCRPSYRIEEHIKRYDTLEDVLAQEEHYPLQQFYLVPWQWKYYAQHRRETDAPRSRLAWLYRRYWSWGLDCCVHLMILALARWFRWRALTRFFYARVLPKLIIRRWQVVDRSEATLVMQHDLFRHIEIEIFVLRRHVNEAASFVRGVLLYFAGQTTTLNDTTRQQLVRIDLLDAATALAGRYVHHYPICFRKVLPDDTHISMAAGDEPYYALSFISFERPRDRQAFMQFAEFLAASTARLFEARPHWGKVCPLDRQTAEALYAQIDDFRTACRRCDSAGNFGNAWLATTLGIAGKLWSVQQSDNRTS